jgi:hypothetical protein
MNQTGTRLVCDQCGAQVMVTKGGDGEVWCDGVPMRNLAAGPPATASSNSTGGAEDGRNG